MHNIPFCIYFCVHWEKQSPLPTLFCSWYYQISCPRWINPVSWGCASTNVLWTTTVIRLNTVRLTTAVRSAVATTPDVQVILSHFYFPLTNVFQAKFIIFRTLIIKKCEGCATCESHVCSKPECCVDSDCLDVDKPICEENICKAGCR